MTSKRWMKHKSIALLVFNLAGATLLCSCVTQDSIRPPLPAAATMNNRAGSGARLILKLRLEGGEELPLEVDAGCFLTILDESLTNMLGPRLGTAVGAGQVGHPAEDMAIYAAPKLFLGEVQLATSRQVLIKNLAMLFPKQQALGILGMDCLRHYCVQLDFGSRSVRFLDPDHLEVAELGEAIPLVMKKCPLGGAVSYVGASFFEHKNLRFWVDTGFVGGNDFMLKPGLYERVVNNHPPNRTGESTSFGQRGLPIANLPIAEFAGKSYRDVTIGEMPGQLIDVPGWMSLQFLARHQVTLNFPKRVMYLKPRG
jgi:hypothetical protein